MKALAALALTENDVVKPCWISAAFPRARTQRSGISTGRSMVVAAGVETVRPSRPTMRWRRSWRPIALNADRIPDPRSTLVVP
mgnify:CR=1 FL=1